MKLRKISPSILDVKKEYMVNYVNTLIDWGVTNVHYDVMDGEFVPNTALEFNKIKEIAQNCKTHQMDIHLMVSDVFKYYQMYKELNAILTFHYEAFKDKETEIKKLIELAKKDHVKLGLAINPDTEIKVLYPYLKNLDLVLIMSVFPGKGGQVFIETSYEKVRKIKQYITNHNLKTIIQIDGGVKNHNIKSCFDAGINLAVVGSYLVKNFSKETVDDLLS